ncbi:MAG: hypothetical protein LBR73_08380 [Oscillospiraceae bacterium]|nr:hypothetical protein [Oscillospiraceae bacterium]
MERKAFKMTPNRRYFFEHFAPAEQEILLGLLTQYEADGVVPEINDSMMHMAFGAIAKNIDAAKKRAATLAAKQKAAPQDATAAPAPQPEETPDADAAPAPPKRSTKELPPPIMHPRGEKFAPNESEKKRIIADFTWFYTEFPFKNNKMPVEKALELWLDEEMDTEPIEYVMKALRRDISCKVFKTHAPTMRQWILRENWIPLVEKAEAQAKAQAAAQAKAQAAAETKARAA